MLTYDEGEFKYGVCSFQKLGGCLVMMVVGVVSRSPNRKLSDEF